MTALILQARLNSSRLPGKALLAIADTPLIVYVMRQLAAIPADAYILACPHDCVESFQPLARSCNFTVFGGSLTDVLDRYCQAAESCGADYIIRATGDNPFVFIDAAIEITRLARESSADYAGFLGLPHGSGVEHIASKSLFLARQHSSDPYEHEHVCPYLYRNPQHFKIVQPNAPSQWNQPKLITTVDTPEDFQRAQQLIKLLGPQPWSSSDILKIASTECSPLTDSGERKHA